MGRLAGFRYREVIRKLRDLRFSIDRQAESSHEIWYNSSTDRYTTIPNHLGDFPEGTLRAILRQAGCRDRRVSFGLSLLNREDS